MKKGSLTDGGLRGKRACDAAVWQEPGCGLKPEEPVESVCGRRVLRQDPHVPMLRKRLDNKLPRDREPIGHVCVKIDRGHVRVPDG